MSDLKSVIFDLDGIIVDSEPIYHEIFQQWLRDKAFDTELINPLDYVGATWEAVLQHVQDDTKHPLDIAAEQADIVNRIIHYVVAIGMPLKENIERTLKLLQPHFTLGITSNSPRAVVERTLKHHGLFNYFTVITAVEDVHHPKPAPESYEKTMLALKTSPDETIIVEDSLNGATAAVASGAFVYVWPDHRFSAEKFAVLLRNNGKVIYGFDELLKDLLP